MLPTHPHTIGGPVFVVWQCGGGHADVGRAVGGSTGSPAPLGHAQSPAACFENGCGGRGPAPSCGLPPGFAVVGHGVFQPGEQQRVPPQAAPSPVPPRPCVDGPVCAEAINVTLDRGGQRGVGLPDGPTDRGVHALFHVKVNGLLSDVRQLDPQKLVPLIKPPHELPCPPVGDPVGVARGAVDDAIDVFRPVRVCPHNLQPRLFVHFRIGGLVSIRLAHQVVRLQIRLFVPGLPLVARLV